MCHYTKLCTVSKRKVFNIKQFLDEVRSNLNVYFN